MAQTIVFLHGLGESPDVWGGVTSAPELAGYECKTPALFTPELLTHGWSLDTATDMLATRIGEQRVHHVGLSLGAVVALNLAIRYPHLVASLFLSAPQAKPPALLMRVQNLLMRLLPGRVVCPPEVTKKQLLAVMESLRRLDLTHGLATVSVPTTVACGAKDRANLNAAHHIATAIPTARLEIVPSAKHQWHAQMPQQFARHVARHLPA
ncbi:alpha/beta fold hydrolase [Trueperella sp.]|uniref:alpha/beta fold hydrolase n=1 Tax=Trueperella sp. TaxID=2699835 RepID=UPI002624F49D|nr:alpha/beta fold hydrolase [Trueperella sp.]